MTENQKPAVEQASEIDDKALDQVVGGIAAESGMTKVSGTPLAPKTSSFGGEEWDKTGK
jgi:hypothetical protein